MGWSDGIHPIYEPRMAPQKRHSPGQPRVNRMGQPNQSSSNQIADGQPRLNRKCTASVRRRRVQKKARAN